MNIIPYDAWVEVFKNISFEERICKLQNVCNNFEIVCGDARLNARLDFSDLVSVSDRLCLETITKAMDAVRYLSFRDCTWFSMTVFAEMPTLNNLVTLDLIGIDPNSYNLSSALKKTPYLKNLRLSMSDCTLLDFVNHNSKRKILNLDVLHVELFCGHLLTTDLKTRYINRFMEICCNEIPRSVSIDEKFWSESKTDPYVERLFQTSVNTIYPGNDIFQHMNGFHMANVAKMLQNCGLHCMQKNSHSELKLNEIRFISIPYNCEIELEDTLCACDGRQYPSFLPALESLSVCVSLDEMASGCYADTFGGILMECKMPKLTHLDLGKGIMNGDTAPAKFYLRLHSFTNLVELNVLRLNVDLFTLLDAIKDLDRLQALSLCVNNSILNRTRPTSLRSNCDRSCGGDIMSTRFFDDLVFAFPNLKKLELERHNDFMDAISSIDLQHIASLSKLEHFSICGIYLKGVHEFKLILRNLENLKSLVLADLDHGYDFDFSRLTGCLKWIPNLTHLHLSQDRPVLLKVLSDDVTKCKQLRSIFIGTVSVDDVNERQITMAFDTLFGSCPNISKFFITTESFSVSVRRAISRYERRMRSTGKTVKMLYGSNYHFDDVKGWYDMYLTQSQVATCDPFDILV